MLKLPPTHHFKGLTWTHCLPTLGTFREGTFAECKLTQELLYATVPAPLSMFVYLKNSQKQNSTRTISGIFCGRYFNSVKREALHIPCSLVPVFTSEAVAAALQVSWAICHFNLNKDKQQLPVLLHFHFSRERIALAGAKNAKALAWNRGNLVGRGEMVTFCGVGTPATLC